MPDWQDHARRDPSMRLTGGPGRPGARRRLRPLPHHRFLRPSSRCSSVVPANHCLKEDSHRVVMQSLRLPTLVGGKGGIRRAWQCHETPSIRLVFLHLFYQRRACQSSPRHAAARPGRGTSQKDASFWNGKLRSLSMLEFKALQLASDRSIGASSSTKRRTSTQTIAKRSTSCFQ